MDIVHNIFYLTTPYLTFWVLLIHILYYLGPLRKFQDSVLLLAIFVSIGGFIITYIHPKLYKLYLKWNGYDREVIISGKISRVIDLAFHQLPLLLLLIFYNPQIKTDNMFLALTVLAIYFLLGNPNKFYSLECDHKIGKGVCALLLTVNVLLIGFFFILLLQKLFI